jgi:hypothetical protein
MGPGLVNDDWDEYIKIFTLIAIQIKIDIPLIF